MTTDTVPKLRGREVTIGGVPTRVTGMAKGAAMIGPNMATMLALVMTDAALAKARRPGGTRRCGRRVVPLHQRRRPHEHERHGAPARQRRRRPASRVVPDPGFPTPLSGKALDDFRATLFEVCEDLAQSIPADGEGATHLITVEVHGCRSRADALQIGKTIADSPLVKTAIAGADPNWGRIVSAAGYAGVQFDPSKVTLYLNGLLLYERGARSISMPTRSRSRSPPTATRASCSSSKKAKPRPASGRPTSPPNTCG